MDSITMELDYTRYLESCIEEQFDMERCVHEALALSESFDAFQNLEAFTEATTGKFRASWEKFKAWIKKAWATFLEKIANTFKGAQSYLDKYKDIILTKKPKDGYTVTMANHELGIQRIFKPTIDKINAADLASYGASIRSALRDATEETYKSTLENIKNDITSIDDSAAFKSLKATYKEAGVTDSTDADHVATTLKQYYLGGEPKAIATTSLNMRDMYDWVYDAEKIKANIEREEKVFTDNCTIIVNEYEKAFNQAHAEAKKAVEADKAAKNANTTTTPPANDVGDIKNNQAAANAQQVARQAADAANANSGGSPKPTSSTGTKESAVYSQLYGRMISINEVEVVKTGDTTTSTAAKAGNMSNTQVASQSTVKNTNANITRDDVRNTATDSGENTAWQERNATWFLEIYKAALNKYKVDTGRIFTAKANATITIAEDYLDIIKAHVRDYVGTKDNVSDNQPVNTATNRDNNNTPKQ